MYVVFTSNYNGGILQFAGQIRDTLKKIGDVVFFVPSIVALPETEKYNRIIDLNPFSNAYKEIALRINELSPEYVFVCDSNLVTSRVVLELKENIKVIMCVHDVKEHPSYKGKRNFIKNWVTKPYIRQGWKRANKILLLSKSSQNLFYNRYPPFAEKTDVLRLGPHVPAVVAIKPPELEENVSDFLLFFGRIDKYKGLYRLMKAFSFIDIKQKLIIAGKGLLTDEEKELVCNNPNIILINRFISDEEMVWLFSNTNFTVLPYIEASQSGVLSVSYYFKKPVIVSNLPGLTEFVDEGVTGLIFDTDEELKVCLKQMSNSYMAFSGGIKEYLKSNLDWDNNIKGCINF